MAGQWISTPCSVGSTPAAFIAPATSRPDFVPVRSGAGYGEICVVSSQIGANERLINDRYEGADCFMLMPIDGMGAMPSARGATWLPRESLTGAQANVSVETLPEHQNIAIGWVSPSAKNRAINPKALSTLRTSARYDVIARDNKKMITIKQVQEWHKDLRLKATPSTTNARTTNMLTSVPNSTLLSTTKTHSGANHAVLACD